LETAGEHPDLARVRRALASGDNGWCMLEPEVCGYIGEAARRYGTSKRLRSDIGQERLRARCEADIEHFLKAYGGRSSLKTYVGVRVIKMIPTVYAELVAEATGTELLSKRQREQRERARAALQQRKELYRRVADRVLELSPARRMVFIAYYREGASYELIASALGKSKDSVRQLNCRARQDLGLSDEEDEAGVWDY
jgi:RNA polymerase sigma factor (sigma-70 family)